MSTGLVIILLGALVVAWIILGCSFAAAFKAPFVVMLPGLALLFAHTLLFDNYDAVPETILAIFSFLGMYLFGLMCVRVIVPKSEEKAKDGEILEAQAEPSK